MSAILRQPASSPLSLLLSHWHSGKRRAGKGNSSALKEPGVQRNKQLGKSNQADQHQAARRTCLSLYHDSSKLACWRGAQINDGPRHLAPQTPSLCRLSSGTFFSGILLSRIDFRPYISHSRRKREKLQAITHQNDTGIKVRCGACDSCGGHGRAEHLRSYYHYYKA